MVQLVNAAYFANLTNSIHAAQSCDQLQQLATEALGSLNDVKSGIAAELAALQPLLALLEVPGANLAALVGWIRNFILSYLTPMVAPSITYAAQLVELEQQIASLIQAISSASARFPSCSISMPTI